MTSSERSVPYYGILNAHIVGRILRQIVTETMGLVFDRRMDFVVTEKDGYDGEPGDKFTDVDVAAQKFIVARLQECFPTWGIIGEEAEEGPDGEKRTLYIPSTHPRGIYVTIDPIDGTKAFTRLQMTGFAVMLSVVMDGEIIAVVIGDVMGGEIFYYRPESEKVHRMHWKGQHMRLQQGMDAPLSQSYAMTKRPPRSLHSRIMKAVLDQPHEGGLFDGFDTGNGSIGLVFAQMWIGAFKAVILTPGRTGVLHDTAWDSTPIIGISRKLGYKFFRVVQDETFECFEEYEPELPGVEPVPVAHDIIVLHERHVPELRAWEADYHAAQAA